MVTVNTTTTVQRLPRGLDRAAKNVFNVDEFKLVCEITP